MHAHALASHAQALSPATALLAPLDYTQEDLGVLAGEPLKTMTMHYKGLKHVDGSLMADDADSEVRWVQKVPQPATV